MEMFRKCHFLMEKAVLVLWTICVYLYRKHLLKFVRVENTVKTEPRYIKKLKKFAFAY